MASTAFNVSAGVAKTTINCVNILNLAVGKYKICNAKSEHSLERECDFNFKASLF